MFEIKTLQEKVRSLLGTDKKVINLNWDCYNKDTYLFDLFLDFELNKE